MYRGWNRRMKKIQMNLQGSFRVEKVDNIDRVEYDLGIYCFGWMTFIIKKGVNGEIIYFQYMRVFYQ